MDCHSWRQKVELRSTSIRVRSAASPACLGVAAISARWRKSVRRRMLHAALSILVLAAATGRATAADPPEAFRQVDGLVIYFAVVPAAFVLGHPAEHTGREMHGGAPESRYAHHLMVALFDATTGSRITDARVTADVQGVREGTKTRIELELMTVGGAHTYGGFSNMPARDSYRIEIEVVRPGGDAVVRAVFPHKHLQP
jgi:hypothetical protein